MFLIQNLSFKLKGESQCMLNGAETDFSRASSPKTSEYMKQLIVPKLYLKKRKEQVPIWKIRLASITLLIESKAKITILGHSVSSLPQIAQEIGKRMRKQMCCKIEIRSPEGTRAFMNKMDQVGGVEDGRAGFTIQIDEQVDFEYNCFIIQTENKMYRPLSNFNFACLGYDQPKTQGSLASSTQNSYIINLLSNALRTSLISYSKGQVKEPVKNSANQPQNQPQNQSESKIDLTLENDGKKVLISKTPNSMEIPLELRKKAQSSATEGVSVSESSSSLCSQKVQKVVEKDADQQSNDAKGNKTKMIRKPLLHGSLKTRDKMTKINFVEFAQLPSFSMGNQQLKARMEKLLMRKVTSWTDVNSKRRDQRQIRMLKK